MKHPKRFHSGKLVVLSTLLISGCMSVPGYTPLGSLPRNNSFAAPGLGYNQAVAMNGMAGNYVAGNYVAGNYVPGNYLSENQSIASNPPSSQPATNSNVITSTETRMPIDATQQLSSGPTEVAKTKGNPMSRDEMQYVNSGRSAQ